MACTVCFPAISALGGVLLCTWKLQPNRVLVCEQGSPIRAKNLFFKIRLYQSMNFNNDFKKKKIGGNNAFRSDEDRLTLGVHGRLRRGRYRCPRGRLQGNYLVIICYSTFFLPEARPLSKTIVYPIVYPLFFDRLLLENADKQTAGYCELDMLMFSLCDSMRPFLNRSKLSTSAIS